MLRILALVCAVIVFVSCSSTDTNRVMSSGNGTPFGNSWNSHCSTYNFHSNVDVTPFTTLGSMYNGSDFAKDIGSMDDMISDDLGEPSGLEGASSSALYVYFDDLPEF